MKLAQLGLIACAMLAKAQRYDIDELFARDYQLSESDIHWFAKKSYGAEHPIDTLLTKRAARHSRKIGEDCRPKHRGAAWNECIEEAKCVKKPLDKQNEGEKRDGHKNYWCQKQQGE